MVNAARKPLAASLRILLKSRGIQISRDTVSRFLDHLNDLDLLRAKEGGNLDPMVMPLWELVRTCLADEDAPGLHSARQTFARAHSECSEELDPPLKPAPKLSDSSEDSGSDLDDPDDVAALDTKDIVKDTKHGPRKSMPSCPGYTDLRQELRFLQPYEALQPAIAPLGAPWPTAPPWQGEELLPGLPPPPVTGGGRSFHQRVWSRLPFDCSGLHAFPVQIGGRGGGGYYEPLEIKQLKAIKDATSAYGPNAPFTMALLEALAGLLLTPGDWTQLAHACLSPGQYLDWKSWNEEFCTEQAATNRDNEHREWNRDMLLGRVAFEEDQTQFPRPVYEQISRCGVQAWRQLAGKGEHTGHLTKIVQGQGEPFSDFVARMLEAANRIFPDTEAAHPLIKQSNKNKTLEDWTRLCRELSGPVTNHGLANAMIAALQNGNYGGKQLGKGNKGKNQGACFNCGQSGHIKMNCPNKQSRGDNNLSSGLCPRCRKGNHSAAECRSIFDKDGRRLSGHPEGQSKNRQRGPHQQVGSPQTQTFFQFQPQQQQTPQTLSGGQLQAPQGWTSVPPPSSY
nr:endogenous retrovirus group K member 10 Gag polyprotein-like [Cavia porcellus]